MEIDLHPDPRAAAAKIYTHARFACNQIEKCTANLVLVGLPAGQGTLLAAQALWAVTRATPFPPVAAVHLTENMVSRFDDLPGRKSGSRLVTIGMGPLEVAHFMAWVHAQTAWQAELRAAVEAALGSEAAPDSVVVLGECDVDEVAAPLMLGLLAALYPEARTRYLAGPGSMLHGPGAYWPIPFADAWVNDAERTVISWPPVDDDARQVFVSDMLTLVRGGGAPGSDSLQWASIGADDPLIERLSAYFPLAELLDAPRWTAALLERLIRTRHRNACRPLRRRRSGRKAQGKLYPYLLPPAFLIGRELWLHRHLTAAEAAQIGGIASTEAAQQLERSLTPGLLEAEEVAGVRTHSLRSEVGILAYGSLRIEPGPELAPYVERRISGITTPFPIEYVRSSPTRAGAPVLVPVSAGYGASAPAEVLVLAPEIDRETAGAMLLRRKLDRAGDVNDPFAVDTGEMQVAELPGFADIPIVLYAAGAPNLSAVIPNDTPLAERGNVLAQLAIASLTPETYAAGHDGIRYLADALAQGIETPLARPYQAAILAQAGGAPDLGAARTWLARQRGIS